MTTPSTPMRTQNSDGASRHTRHVEPTPPSNFQHTKRQRAVNTAPERMELPGKGAGTDNTAQAFLSKLVRSHSTTGGHQTVSAKTGDEFVQRVANLEMTFLRTI
ncbi:hypothetical protein E4U57_003365 [Claviceps arundinis]|uniref:Uncharacterized protein n=1 Tax=Claviceps arundinis TaxID=1623583 RepID=A0A9P7MR58_9HYPO|nr:hypothetical protein E4U57_003365 [Claviceps arundinis]KAG5964495.1 hypothetical protein E4U56_002151 [Claviceps arundinis]